jgi:hypothetical protein
MKREAAYDELWVRDQVGRLGLLKRSPNGWDVAYANETKQSVDLTDYEPADPIAIHSPPPVVNVRGSDGLSGLRESRRK